MTDRAKYITTGFFVAVAFTSVVTLVMLFGSVPAFFQSHDRYTVILSSAQGVAPGTAVRRSGVPIGRVETVELDNESGRVRVGILIDKKYTIWENEEAQVKRDLLGNTAIDFMPRPPVVIEPPDGKEVPPTGGSEMSEQGPEPKKPAPPKPVPPGSVIQGKVPADPQSVLNEVSRIMPAAEQTLIDLGKAAQGFNQVTPQFDRAVREVAELSRATREVLPEVRRTNEEAQNTIRVWGSVGERLNVLLRTNEDLIVQTLKDLDDALVRITRALSDENLKNWGAILVNGKTASERLPSIAENTDAMIKEARATLKRMDATLVQAQTVFNNLQRGTQPLADRSDRVMRNFDESSERLNRVLADAQELMQVINRKDGTFQRVIADPSLYNNLNDVACQISHMMPRVERLLKDMEVFADKLARHPESIGIGGAVRPSSGLK